ncbi:MAG: hypothetical protein IMZ62_09335 [Chloroflexi bacterium]|nr:hypothetical protein [Chloroflexota bacterium]
MRSLLALVGVVLVSAMAALFIISNVGLIASGIWLAILGQWLPLGLGILVWLLGGRAVGVALIPGSLLIAAPAAACLVKGRRVLGMALLLLFAIHTGIVMGGWAVGVLYVWSDMAGADSMVPMLIWSYGLATGAIVWLCMENNKADPQPFFSVTPVLSQVGYIVAVVMLLCGAARINAALAVMCFVCGGILLEGALSALSESRWFSRD